MCCPGGTYSSSADVRNLTFDDSRIPVVKREMPSMEPGSRGKGYWGEEREMNDKVRLMRLFC